jgi:hypothetical protein
MDEIVRLMPVSPVMQFNGISASDGERLLAAIWCILEERTLASPLVEVRSAKGTIDITMTFRSAEDRAAVERDLGGNAPASNLSPCAAGASA